MHRTRGINQGYLAPKFYNLPLLILQCYGLPHIAIATQLVSEINSSRTLEYMRSGMD